MAHTLFISDVHLSPEQPEITQNFNAFIQSPATRQADALYILGDFFDIWLGADVDTAWSETILQQLKTLTDIGMPVYFMHGNHDSLVEPTHLAQYGIQFIADPTLINLYGRSTVLLHGDTLCTHDKGYMRLRKILRNQLLQRYFRRLPIAWRQSLANKLKHTSQKASAKKSKEMIDVNPTAVDALFTETGAKQMIHGHTHRPALHANQRFVMDAWHQSPSILMIKQHGQIQLHQAIEELDLETLIERTEGGLSL